MYGNRSYPNLTAADLLDRFCDTANTRYGSDLCVDDIIPWATSLLLDGQAFSLTNHEYQRDMLIDGATRHVFLKGAQIGATSIIMLRTLHGLIAGRYPQGALYLFPSRGDVQDFSRGRFNPLINDNEQIAKFVQDTDAQTIKRIGRSMLYMRGARSTARIGGMKRTSSQLKSIPVDRVVFDECDEMEPAMIDLALERLSHSSVREEVYLSTPTIPDFGVDKLYNQSDQRVWMIKCQKCGGETCLELEFPECLEELTDGRIIRLCQKCRNNEIHPRDGRWVPMCPGNAHDMIGWRISQLNSVYVDPAKILKLFRDPPNGNLSEVYNSKLGQAHVAAENRLTPAEVVALCGQEPMAEGDPGPCFMGVDVGTLLHCVIGKRHADKKGEIVYVGAFPDWGHLNSLMNRFNVSRAVIDALPETRLSREFAREHRGIVFCCFYQEHQKGAYAWNEKNNTVSANRTESLDASHAEFSHGEIALPRECEIIHTFARHCSSVARVLQTDPETGSSRYIYLKTGPDHFRHAFNYECMARQFAARSFFAGCDLS